MHPILSTPAFPQAFFMRVAHLTGGVDRVTVENWIRGASLTPASLSGSGDGEGVGGPTFSVGDLIKVLAMAEFRSSFGTPPRKASALADEVISAYETEILQVLRANDDGTALPGPVAHQIGRFAVALPLNWWAARAAGVLETWSQTAGGEADKLREVLSAWRSERES